MIHKLLKRRNERGFTLIEVLAALLIFSLAIMGLTRTGTQSAQAVAALEQKTWASVIADNQLALVRAQTLRKGRVTGEGEVMGRDYVYAIDTQDTDTPGFFKVTIDVRQSENGQIIVQRTGFMSAPAAVAQ